jgi:hypothetical protein
VLVSLTCAAVLLVELTLFLVLRDRFIALSHGIAAATMVAGVIAVMVLSALRTEERHRAVGDDSGRGYRRIYLAIAVALTAALAATVVAALTVTGFAHLVLVAEVIVIVLFATYWGVQTKELWDLGEVSADEARDVGARAE